MTFLEMQTRVGELINQAVTDDTKTITETEVKANLNVGYNMVKGAVTRVNQSFYLRKADTDTVASQASYTLPTDLRRISRVEIEYVDGTPVKAQYLDRNFKESANLTYSTDNPAYSVVGNMIELDPTPSSAVTDGLIIWYIENPADMSNDADEPSLPVGYEYLPVLYATSRAKRKLGLDGEANTLYTEFRAEIANMQDELLRTEDDNDLVVMTDM